MPRLSVRVQHGEMILAPQTKNRNGSESPNGGQYEGRIALDLYIPRICFGCRDVGTEHPSAVTYEPITQRELSLLVYLVTHAAHPQTSSDIAIFAKSHPDRWGDAISEPLPSMSTNAVKQVLRRLRRKFHGRDIVRTVRGHGYLIHGVEIFGQRSMRLLWRWQTRTLDDVEKLLKVRERVVKLRVLERQTKAR